jgi:phosphoglucosamine mutase
VGQYFGTDGIRGVANRDLSPELVFRLGLAAGTVLQQQGAIKHMVVGMDSRRSGPMLGAALAAGLCAAGMNVYEVGMLPTPGVAFLARTMEDCGGAVISASHNPAKDNGIKFFNHQGFKLDDEMEAAIEALIDAPPAVDSRPMGADIGWIKPLKEGVDMYADYLHKKAYCDLSGLVIVADCANGAASEVGPKVLRAMGAQVISICDLPDGSNINDHCGSTHIEKLQEAVLKYKAHIGLAFDGDADRLMAVDAQGQVVDGDQIMVILGMYMQAHGWLDGQVVVTVMSNLGLKKAFEAAGIKVVETKVGDRFVLEKMLEIGAWLGGEQSGHIILTRDATTGDGLMTALHLLLVMQKTGQSLADLAGQMTRYPQVLINVPVKSKEGWQTNPDIVAGCEAVNKALDGKGRLLVRPSGTEPLLRVMVEGPDKDEIQGLAQELAQIISKALS